jgi:hypothetical protein
MCNREKIIGYIARYATYAINLFNENRKECCHHKFNILTERHNCFEGNTKTECNVLICPLKEQGIMNNENQNQI